MLHGSFSLVQKHPRHSACDGTGLLRIDVRTWKEEANAVRLSIYAALLSLAAQNGRGKAWAEAFFKKYSSASEHDDDDEPMDGGELPAAV